MDVPVSDDTDPRPPHPPPPHPTPRTRNLSAIRSAVSLGIYEDPEYGEGPVIGRGKRGVWCFLRGEILTLDV